MKYPGGWKSFTAGLESSFNLNSIDKSSEDVKRIYYSYFDNHSIHSYAIKNYGSIDTLRSMLSENFVAAINRNITETRDKSDKELAEYLIQTYGTHLITGIILGGRIEYSQVFNTTNRELYEKIQRVEKEKASMGLKGIFSENLSTETSATLEEIRKDSSTITQTVVYTLGGMSVGLWTEEKLNENYNDWAKSLNEEENLNAIGVTENGMIALWSLIPDEPKYQGLRKEMESLYESTGKSVYDGVIEKYSATLSDEIKRTGKRTIDLSNYFCYDKDTISDITPGAYKDIYHNNILTLNGSYLGIPVYHYEIVGGYGIQDMYGDTQHSAVKLSLAVNSEHDLAITLQNIKMVSADGKPAIYLDDKVKDLEVAVTLLIENEVELKAGTNSEAVIDLKDMSIEGDGNLSVMGRNGNAQMQQAESEQGGIGICANNFTIAMNGKLTVNGGNGGNAYNRKNVKGDANTGDRSNGNPGYAGGNGGVGIFATSIVVKSGDIVVKSGNGGQGGDGGECNYAWGSSVKGGKGGNGGNGANAIRVQNLNIQAGVLFAYGGNGGDTGKRGGADSNDYGDGVFDAGGASNGDLGIVGIGGRGLSADSIDGNSMLITEEKGKDGTVNYDLNWD